MPGGLTILSIIGQTVDISPYDDRPEGAPRSERKVEGETPYHKWDDGLFAEERLRVMRALGL